MICFYLDMAIKYTICVILMIKLDFIVDNFV